jgi:hypothetical protein
MWSRTICGGGRHLRFEIVWRFGSARAFANGGIAGRRRGLVDRCGRSKDFREDRLQTVGPDLIAPDRRMQPVHRHSVEEPAVGIRQLVVDVEVAHLPAIGERRDVPIDLIDLWYDGEAVVAGKDRRQDDGRLRRFCTAQIDDGLDPTRDVRDLGLAARLPAHVVGARLNDDDLRVDTIDLAVREPPQNVLDAVSAPSEVRSIPAEEVLSPVGEEVGIIERSPPSGDGIADEIHVDAASFGLCQQLVMSHLGITVGARHRPVARRHNRLRRWEWRHPFGIQSRAEEEHRRTDERPKTHHCPRVAPSQSLEQFIDGGRTLNYFIDPISDQAYSATHLLNV